MDNKQIAKEVIEALGGRDNVRSVAHCATRLRVMVVDEAKIDKERAENIDKVKGAFFNSGQYQIIFGTGTVNKIYDEVVDLGLPTSSTGEQKQEAAAQGNWFQRMSRTFGDVFVPIIPVLVATGLFMGLRGLLTNDTFLGFFGASSKDINANFILYTQVLTDTAFAFLPALIAWSSFKVFGGNPVLGIVLGLMMVNPALPNAYAVASGDAKALTFFGFIPVVGYQGTVLPAFFVGMIGARLENWLHKRVPEALDLLITPFLTFLVMSILGLFAIGPVFHSVETVVLAATEWILALPFGIAGIIIGGLQQVIVVTGVHHIFNFLETQLLAETKANPFNPLLSAATAGQVGAVLAVAVKTKSAKLKALAYPSALSAALGITEPAIFGVNLRYGKPFVMGLVGGSAGGFIAALVGLKATGMSVTVLPGLLLFLNSQMPMYIVSITVACAIAFALTYYFGYADKEEDVSAKKPEAPAAAPVAETETKSEVIASPLDGEAVELSKVNDPVFSSEAMGKGIAVKPSGNTVYSPVNGTVQIAFETGHAYGLKSDNGAEVLIHVGIDTVSMNGTGFDQKVAANQTVKVGDVLGTFDSAKIAEAGLDDTTMVIITNTADYSGVKPLAAGQLAHGADLLELNK